ncbi:MAG: hypothetical protein WC782_12555 [Methylococcaceae bacterium]|jgi:hypothetical protein
MALLSLNEQVLIKEIGGGFLAFCSQSGETIVLNPITYKILKLLNKPLDSSTILAILHTEFEDQTEQLSVFLDSAINELIGRGFIIKEVAIIVK